jgi:hypothetical protein
MRSTNARSLKWWTAAAVLLCAALPAYGQFAVPWFTIDGGGVQGSTGGTFSLSGTVGQPDSGQELAGGSFTLIGGFWPGLTIPCPGELTGDGKVDQSDLGVLLAAYGTCPGDPSYNAAAGALAGDPCVTQADLGVLLAAYGIPCP